MESTSRLYAVRAVVDMSKHRMEHDIEPVSYTHLDVYKRQGREGKMMMFGGLTERAQRVLQLSQGEARRLGHDVIGTEHLLLGLVAEGTGIAARALQNLGISLEDVRQAVEKMVGKGDTDKVKMLTLTPRAKKVLELAMVEARQLGQGYIGTEHILLGLIREGEGIAAQVLTLSLIHI